MHTWSSDWKCVIVIVVIIIIIIIVIVIITIIVIIIVIIIVVIIVVVVVKHTRTSVRMCGHTRAWAPIQVLPWLCRQPKGWMMRGARARRGHRVSRGLMG
jgi:hypothetical protein